MSGRWRSRHWRPEDDTTQQHRGGGGGGRGVEHQNSYDSRSYYGGPASWNGGGGGNNHQHNQDYDHGGQFYRRDDMSYNHHQQYHQQHDPRYHDNRRPQQQQQYYNEMPPRNNYNYSNDASDDRRGGRWQRGQNPAHRHHGHPHQQQHDMRSGTNGRANNSNPSQHNNRAAPSSKRSDSSGSNSNHSFNPSNNAWGRQPSSAAPKQSDSSDGNVKAENANTSTRKSMKESSVNNSNAWKKPNLSSSSFSSATGSSVKSEFPSLSSAKESSQHDRKPSSDNGDVSTKVEMEEDNNINIAPSSTLPTASSWGKSHSSLGWGAAKQPPPPSKKKEQGSGAEFPSLSASLDAPPRKQQPQGTMADVSLNKEETTKKGGNKKSAGSTNLASFLMPQLGDTSEKKKGNTTTNKKQPPTNNVSKAGQKPANVHTDNKKKHPREDSRAPFHQHHRHAAITSTTTNSASATTTTTTGAPPIKKGRQRLAPRKKKLTTLKKRVLEERLRIWKERNGEESVDPVAGEADAKTSGSHQQQEKGGSEKSTTLLVDNFVNPEEDDLTDDDEHDELVTNLINLAGRVGRVVSVYIPRPSSDNNDEVMGGESSALEESNHVGLSFVRLATYQDAHAARDILDGMVVGGQKLRTKILYSMELEVCDCEFVNKSPAASPSQDNEQQWRRVLFKAIVSNQTSSSLQEKTSLHKDGDGNASLQPSSESTIVFYNILSSDDYEDEDALEESIEDIQSIAGQYGHVANARGDDAGNVYVTYDTRDIASFAAQKLDGMLLGGVSITVSVDSSMSTNRTQQAGSSTVVLDNVLSEDDFEDEDCLNESIEDIRSLAEKYGVVGSLIVDASNEGEKGKIHVEYTGGIAVAGEAAKQLNGMMFGGRLISATLLLSSGTEDTNLDNNSAAKSVKDDTNTNVEQEPPQPMFSGDKVIPERFAQCKRVPKVANSGTPRAYASKIADPGAIPLLTEMLGELMRLQQRSKDQKNARSRRRLVMGLREVARGIRAHKVKMVVMANNLDEYGAIDSKLQEILDLAHAEDVPVIFELNKRKLGKAVGKSIKVSVVGVQNVMGAEQQFKQLKKMAGIS